MKIRLIVLSVTILLTAIAAVKSIYNSSSTVGENSTPPGKADHHILRAQQSISRSPNSADGYNQLASAYMQKARETANFSFNANAGDAITRSLAIEPDNYDGLKLRTKLQLTYHRFAEALETARRIQTIRQDDHDVWGQITDALVELGDYPGAVKAAQTMVDLRPDSSSYARVSYLRSLHGDTEGAIAAMIAAVKAANPNDPESVAWCRVQLGNELMNAGKLVEAEREFDAALVIFPNHSLALQGKARARIAADDLQAAVAIYQQENGSADAAQALGDLFTRLGKSADAKAAYETFETLERENAAIEKSWRHMVNFWLDHDQNLVEALRLASDEYNSRKDIFTCDSLAWALFKNGRVTEARKVMKEALRTGTKDQRIKDHAVIINQG
ncbi:MAG TPA: tetratricopeptide repeat protein [Pyrinomonadaceae bacterium]|jgi:tetratricopeptide (TPR) repeat protein|nr:tetratricopeptide repeat protein [Pyrinomonadaceae bacterium]